MENKDNKDNLPEVQITDTSLNDILESLGIDMEALNYEKQCNIRFYKLDDNNQAGFVHDKFYKSTYKNKDSQWSNQLLFAYEGFELKGLLLQSNVWKIKFSQDNNNYVMDIEDTLTFLQTKLHLEQKTTSLLAQFFERFRGDFERKHYYEIAIDPFYVEDNIIHVNSDMQDIKTILETLNSMYTISTNPEAFTTIFCYNIIAPTSYYIREKSQKFPYLMLSGMTTAGKTTHAELFVVKGFKRKLNEAKMSLGSVKTQFTLGKKVEESILPFIADDVNNEWLNVHAEELKGATDNILFMSRGRANQTVREYKYQSQIEFTQNQQPNIPLALAGRMIILEYTQLHAKSQNKKEWERLSQQLPEGFMFNILKELLDGKNVDDIIKNIHKSVIKDDEISQQLINYAFSLLSGLYSKYNLVFSMKKPIIKQNINGLMITELIGFMLTKINDNPYRTEYANNRFYNDEANQRWLITTTGYNDFIKEFTAYKNITHIKDFVNETKLPGIEAKNSWFSPLKKMVYCLIIPDKYIKR